MRRVLLISQAVLALAITISAGCHQTWPDRPEGDPLQPDRHRAQIVRIDAILFQDGPLKQSDRQPLEQEILAIADAASADPSNAFARALSLDLRLLSTMAASGPVSTPVANSELTGQWSRIRGSLFRDAAWFRRRPTDPIASAVPVPARETHARMR